MTSKTDTKRVEGLEKKPVLPGYVGPFKVDVDFGTGVMTTAITDARGTLVVCGGILPSTADALCVVLNSHPDLLAACKLLIQGDDLFAKFAEDKSGDVNSSGLAADLLLEQAVKLARAAAQKAEGVPS